MSDFHFPLSRFWAGRVLARIFVLTLLCLLVSCGHPHWGHSQTVRLGILPSADTLALHVAVKEGIFAEQGLEIELVPFQSALESLAAMRAGALQALYGDIPNMLQLHDTGVALRIVATSSYANPRNRHFGVAFAPKHKGATLETLRGAQVAVSRATVIDFLLESMLTRNGLGPEYFSRLDIRQIGVRMQMLLNNQIDAALLPEPLLSAAEARGAQVLLDDCRLSMPLAVLAFSAPLAQADTVRRFQDSMRKAAMRINQEPEKYRALMQEKKLLPKAARQYEMPSFDPAHIPSPLPTRQEIETVARWMLQQRLLRTMPVWEEIVFQ